MSLESEIKNLTVAVNRLAEGVEKLLSISQPIEMHGADPVDMRLNSAIGTSAPESVKNPRKSEAREPAPASETQEASAPSSAGAGPVEPTFDDAKKAFLAIAQKFGAVEGTAKSREVLQRYGIPNLKALPVEQYPDFIELCDHVVAGGAA